MDIEKNVVGTRIRQIRQNKGMTLEEFGNLLNAGKSNVSKWEKGLSLPNNERLKQISKIGGMTVNELLYGSTWEYAKQKINAICEKYKITDSYLNIVFENYLPSLKETFEKKHTPKEVVINLFLLAYGGGSYRDFYLSYEMVDSSEFEEAFLKEIGFNAAMQDLNLKEKITQFLYEIMDIEISEFQNQKYKEFYDPDIKEDAIKFMLTRYSFDSLSDIGIKAWTKELAEIYLDRLNLFKNYKPYSDSNAIDLAVDLLSDRFKNYIGDYFKKENLSGREYYLPVKDNIDNIKDELTYDTYSKIIGIIETAYQDIKKLK